ncbi:MAG: hypothetical protein RIR48_1043 [Bacteroidota bacterium]|jgi:large subunit ribosomal protein L24
MSDSKRFAPKLHIKKGDNVMVIAGSNKGLKGEVKLVLTKENRAIVDGVNMVKKHIKSTQENPGGINEMEAPIHISNLKLIDPKTGTPTRIGRKVVDGKSVRYSKKSGEIIK